jgi:hypothetical protein
MNRLGWHWGGFALSTSKSPGTTHTRLLSGPGMNRLWWHWGGFALSTSKSPGSTHNRLLSGPGMNRPNSGQRTQFHTTNLRNMILRMNRALLATFFMLVSCLAYSSTLKMEATCSPDTLVVFQRTTVPYIFIGTDVRTSYPTRRYIPEDRALHNH